MVFMVKLPQGWVTHALKGRAGLFEHVFPRVIYSANVSLSSRLTRAKALNHEKIIRVAGLLQQMVRVVLSLGRKTWQTVMPGSTLPHQQTSRNMRHASTDRTPTSRDPADHRAKYCSQAPGHPAFDSSSPP
jgi:hypothetical protein